MLSTCHSQVTLTLVCGEVLFLVHELGPKQHSSAAQLASRMSLPVVCTARGLDGVLTLYKLYCQEVQCSIPQSHQHVTAPFMKFAEDFLVSAARPASFLMLRCLIVRLLFALFSSWSALRSSSVHSSFPVFVQGLGLCP